MLSILIAGGIRLWKTRPQTAPFASGRKNNVLVHKFVCPGTIEEKINTLINEKTALANDLLEGGADTLLTEMDNETLLNLVSLDIEKSQA